MDVLLEPAGRRGAGVRRGTPAGAGRLRGPQSRGEQETPSCGHPVPSPAPTGSPKHRAGCTRSAPAPPPPHATSCPASARLTGGAPALPQSSPQGGTCAWPSPRPPGRCPTPRSAAARVPKRAGSRWQRAARKQSVFPWKRAGTGDAIPGQGVTGGDERRGAGAAGSGTPRPPSPARPGAAHPGRSAAVLRGVTPTPPRGTQTPSSAWPPEAAVTVAPCHGATGADATASPHAPGRKSKNTAGTETRHQNKPCGDGEGRAGRDPRAAVGQGGGGV